MASFEGTYARYLLRSGVVQSSVADTPVAMRLRYVGTGTVTSVTTVTGTSITAITTDGGTDAYAFATYTTLGALAAAINADGIFQAKVLDALNSDATTGGNYQVTGAIVAGADSNGTVVWDMLTDTSVALNITATLTGNRDWDSNWFNAEKVGGHRPVLQSIYYLADVGTAAANSVRVYIRRGLAGRVETKVLGQLSVDNTGTTLSFASGAGMISGRDGDEIIVRVLDAGTLSDTGLVLQAIGYLE
jgi:hypothetical protein